MIARAALLAAAVLLPAPRAQAVAFERDVLPILEASCLRCHRAESTDENGRVRRPKGGLRLDGRAWIEKGGKGGKIVTPGQPAQSALYARTVLPPDHDDRMPASGEPLDKAQTDVLRRWIEQGADFGAWVGEAGPAADAAPEEAPGRGEPAGQRSLDLARVASGLTPLPAATVAKAAAKAQVTPLWHGSALLRVEFAGHEDEVGDPDVAALAPLREHVAVLVLARTKVSDAACTHLARMPRLVRLDLRDTRISDAGLARLRSLPELRALNLFATDVGDASVDVLAGLQRLEEVRLWQTRVTPGALERLRQARPGLDVTAAAELPGAAPQRAPTRGRRR